MRAIGRKAWAAAASAALLAGCGDGGSAVQTRDRSLAAGSDLPVVPAIAPEASAEGQRGVQARPPVLTANRRETTDAKVIRLFQRNGADFGSTTADDYLAKVDAFTRRPPPGTERVERANGDVLLYQASTNTFAVVSREGVAKTMFKPREGAAYWAEEKAAAPTFGRRAPSSER